ncbi:MAG: tyrosine-type recombinase/integrase, partial [Xanthobacteraceae bacterium]
MIAHLRVVEPRNENRTVPVRPSNDDLRPREYLTPGEVETLIKAARDGRYGHRDATLILVAYRHGLRAIEICDLEWSQVEFGRNATLHVRRAKNGKPAAHPIRGDELRALHKLKAETDTAPTSSPPNAAARFRQTPSIGLSSALVRVRGCRSRSTSICCATPAAISWPTTATIRGLFRTGSAIVQSSIRRAIR